MSYTTRTEIETRKVLLQYTIKNLLCSYSDTLTENEDCIICRAMEYIVKSHNSYDEQYNRINEFQYALDGIKSHHATQTSIHNHTIANNIMMFGESDTPF